LRLSSSAEAGLGLNFEQKLASGLDKYSYEKKKVYSHKNIYLIFKLVHAK